MDYKQQQQKSRRNERARHKYNEKKQIIKKFIVENPEFKILFKTTRDARDSYEYIILINS